MSQNRVLEVRVYGSHRRLLPEGDTAIVPYVPGETIKALLDRLTVPRDEVGVLAVNGAVAGEEYVLCPGDKVAIMSPVSGG